MTIAMKDAWVYSGRKPAQQNRKFGAMCNACFGKRRLRTNLKIAMTDALVRELRNKYD